MKNLVSVIILICFLNSCNNNERMSFDSEKWKPYESGVIGENYRKKMVFDLVHNRLNFGSFDKKGTSLKEVVELIDKPFIIDKISNNDNFKFIYEIEEKFDYNIDPNGGTTLELTFDKDSTLTSWRINEFWYKP